MKIGDRLKIAREMTKMSQKEFASLIGASYRAVQDYEGNVTVPGGKVIESYVRQGFDANWILIGEGDVYRDGHTTLKSSLPLIDTPPEKGGVDGSRLVRDIVEQYEIHLEEICKVEDRAQKARSIANIFRYFADIPSRYGGSQDVSKFIAEWFW